MTGSGGPYPGTIKVAQNHTEPDLSQIVTPGLCRLQNLDLTNSVYYGIYSSHYNDFFPLGKLLPQTTQVIYLCDLLGRDMQPGTGTSPGDAFTNKLSFKALAAPCYVLIEVFDA
jgi:hypothetical protein